MKTSQLERAVIIPGAEIDFPSKSHDAHCHCSPPVKYPNKKLIHSLKNWWQVCSIPDQNDVRDRFERLPHEFEEPILHALY